MERLAVDRDLAAGGRTLPDRISNSRSWPWPSAAIEDLAGTDLERDAGVLPVDQQVADDRAGRVVGRGAGRRSRATSRTPTLASRASRRRSGPQHPPGRGGAGHVATVAQDGAHVAVLALPRRLGAMNSTDRLRSFQRTADREDAVGQVGQQRTVISSRISSCGSKTRARARSSMRRKGRGMSRTCSSRSSRQESMAASSRRTAARSTPVRRRFATVVASQRRVLVDRRQALDPGVDRAAQDRGLAVDGHRPAVVVQHAGQDLDQGGLPGAVGPSRACTSPGATERSTARRTAPANALATAVVCKRAGIALRCSVAPLRVVTGGGAGCGVTPPPVGGPIGGRSGNRSAGQASVLAGLAGEELLVGVGGVGLRDGGAEGGVAVGKLLASSVALLVSASQTSGVSSVSRSICLPVSTSRASAVPTPPMTAGLVTAAPGCPRGAAG